MMYQGLDLSRFKRLASDKTATTLVHSHGHKIKIAHQGISPKMKDELAKMPLHLAEGGEPLDEFSPSTPEEEPDAEGDDAPEEGDAEEETPEDPAAPAAPSAPDVAPEEPDDATSGPPVLGTPKPSPDDNVIPVIGHRQPPTTKEELDNHDAEFARDMAHGRIKKETIQDLYNKKDTLGKVSTLFGILVGGLGSGLTGQPNAVLEMMNKQIENDFESQKLTNENAQNWWRLSQSHEMQKANIKRLANENELTKAQVGKIPSEIEQTKASTANARADADLKATAGALNRMKLGVLSHLGDTVEKIPPGPNKDAATNALNNVVAPAVQKNISDTNAATAGQLNARAKLRGDAPEQQAGAVDYDKLNKLEQMGRAFGDVGAGISPAAAAQARTEASEVEKNRALYNSWKDSFEHLDRSALGGIINPADRGAAVDLLTAQIAKSTGSSTEIAKRQADSLFPGPKDWGNARTEKAKKGVEHFMVNEAGTGALNSYHLKGPFPGPPTLKKDAPDNKPKGKEEKPKEGMQKTKIFNGVEYKRGPNGESIPVK